ncbi:MAG: hypothetical protein WAQ27_04030 [Candidatus Microsaccharimonas sp.]
MVRLPQPGADGGQWGEILNEFLRQTHTADGALKSGTVTTGTIADDTITEAKLDTAVRTKLNTVGGAPLVESVAGKTGAVTLVKGDVGLDSVDNTSDIDKPVSSATQTALNDKAAIANTVQLSGNQSIGGIKDFTGTLRTGGQQVVATNDARLTNQRVPVDQSVTVDKLAAGPANQNQALFYDGADLVWTTITPGGAISDASASEKGLIQLTGDLSGTAGAPVVDKVKGVGISATVPTSGQVLTATSDTTAIWQNPASAPVTTVAGKTGAVSLVKADVGLGNADNTSDANKPISSATQTALDAKQGTAQKGQASGYASLDSNTRVPSAQLGSGTANTTTYLRGDGSWQAVGSSSVTAANITDATTTGRSVLTATDAAAARTAIGAGTSSLAIGTTSTTAKAGDYAPTKTDVGLGNADNTSDTNKPISTATQTALDTKVQLTGDQSIAGVKNFTGSLQAGGQAVVVNNDARLTNQRTPVDGSVTAAKLSAGPVSQDQVLSYDGSGLIWTTVTANGIVNDASTIDKGIVQLAGDLGGTAGAPTVRRVNGVTVTGTPATGNVLTATSTTAANWQAAPQTVVSSSNITDSTATGRSVLTATDAATARTAIGAGTSNLAIGTTSTTAKAGNYAPTKTDVGLANVDNTSDANKPVSTATQTALNAKANTTHSHAAADIASGTIAAARLGSGTPDNTKVLLGNSTWVATSTLVGSGSDSGTAANINNPASETAIALAPITEYQRLLNAIPFTLDNVVPTVDAAPAVQALIDAGYAFNGQVRRNYLFKTPIFIDSTPGPNNLYGGTNGLFAHPEWNVQGIIYVDGRTMPTIRTWVEKTLSWSDSVNKGCVFVGVRRSAWDVANNRVTMHNGDGSANSTKSYYRGSDTNNNDGTPFAFKIKNTTIRSCPGTVASDNNVIFIRSLTGGTRDEDCTLKGLMGFKTWMNYTDLHSSFNPFTESDTGQNYTGAYLIQSTEGDGVIVSGGKSNGPALISLTRNRGAVLTGLVTAKATFNSCESVSIIGVHEEGNISDEDRYLIKDSGITIQDSVYYARDEGVTTDSGYPKPLGGELIIDDSEASDDGGSTLILRNVLFCRRIDAYYFKYGPLVEIRGAKANTTLIFQDVRAVEVANLSPGVHRKAHLEAIWVTGTDSTSLAIKAAISAPSAQALIASGNFKVSRQSTGWVVSPLHDVVYTANRMGQPSVTLLGGPPRDDGAVAGALTVGGTYEYAVATENTPGRITLPATASSTVPSSGYIHVSLRNLPFPAVTHVWRKNGTGVLTAPTHYAKLLTNSSRVPVYDWGPSISGVQWVAYVSGTHPAPPTVATTRTVQIIAGQEYVPDLWMTLYTNMTAYPKPNSSHGTTPFALSGYSLSAAPNAYVSGFGVAEVPNWRRTTTSTARVSHKLSTGLAINTQYTVIFSAKASVNATFGVQYRPAGGSSSSGAPTSQNVNLTTSEQTFAVTFTTGSTAPGSSADIAFYSSAGANDDTLNITKLCVLTGSHTIADYFDGDNADDSWHRYSWTGTAGASTSTYEAPA